MALALRRGAIVAMVGLLVAVAGGPAPAAHAQTAAARVTVMSFNVCGGVCRGGEVTRTAAYTVRTALRHKASVVLLQELCYSQFLPIRARLGRAGYIARFAVTTSAGACDNHDRKHGKGFGVAVLVRGKTSGTVVRRLPTPRGAEGRVLLGTNATLGGRRTFVAVVHLTPSPQTVLSRQLHTVAALLDSRARHPAIVGGDFNAKPSYAGLNRLYGRSAGGFGRFLEANGRRGGQATFDGGAKVDYIFFTEAQYERPTALSIPTTMSDHHVYIGTAVIRPL
jgi:endonuclease/exonuclease/phosphatase family metal-dependent hydrolase